MTALKPRGRKKKKNGEVAYRPAFGGVDGAEGGAVMVLGCWGEEEGAIGLLGSNAAHATFKDSSENPTSSFSGKQFCVQARHWISHLNARNGMPLIVAAPSKIHFLNIVFKTEK